jgi:transglutaminase-like putative cysteine protease
MKLLTVRHATTYRYAAPVTFGQHRLMLRPRDSHDLWLRTAELTLSPPGTVRWMHDVFGNSVALVDFAQPAAELSIVSTLTLERFALDRPRFPVDPDAETYPFVYSDSDRGDLGRLLDRHYPDPTGVVDEWLKRFTAEKPVGTLALLAAINKAIHDELTYQMRYAEGTQSPVDTLTQKAGTCRDYALLFIEAARTLGFGARFVTGYLYDPTRDGGMQGAGATHAWAEVYVPGAGWIEFDPTNELIAAESLIRVAVTRDASQAVPIAGTFTGGASLGMTVEVSVTSESR